MSVCHTCNNLGKEGGCPKCGLTPRNEVGNRILKTEIPTDIIPKMYQGVMWEKIENENLPLQFKQFDDALEKVYNSFLQGKIPEYSMFISAPSKSGKNLFAYSCMQTSITNRFSVAPLLSTSDWRRLLKVSQINPFYKLYGRYQWDSLVTYDLVFLFVDHSDDRFDSIPIIKSILDARAAFNLSTFIISDYRLNDLVPKWNSDIYTMIYNSNPKRDHKRYPVVLHRFE